MGQKGVNPNIRLKVIPILTLALLAFYWPFHPGHSQVNQNASLVFDTESVSTIAHSSRLEPPLQRVPAKRVAALTIEQMKERIQNDQLCFDNELWPLRYDDKDLGYNMKSTSYLYTALTQANGEEPWPCILALTSLTLADVLRWTDQRTEPLCRLWRGLALTGQLILESRVAYAPEAPPLSDEQVREGLDTFRHWPINNRRLVFIVLFNLVP